VNAACRASSGPKNVRSARSTAAKSAAAVAVALDSSLLRDAAEVALAQALEQVGPRIAESAARREFAFGLAAAAELAPTIDRFFTDAMVMDEDRAVRANRLRLMLDVVEATRPIGDLSALPG
jgi:glycyl-tRNA synthetase beta chain